MTLIVIVLLPLVKVPLGIEQEYTSPYPRYAPLVTPRLSIFVGAAGAAHVYPFTIAWGLPPPNDSVVAIRKVVIVLMVLESEKVIFWPLLTDMNIAIGQEEVAVEDTLPGLQFDIL